MKWNQGLNLAPVVLASALAFAAGAAQSQTLLSQTTWGSGVGYDLARGVALAPDGSSYVLADTESFTVDGFGNPRYAIGLLNFDSNGVLAWQKVWTGLTPGASGIARAADGSIYISGTASANNGDALLLKFDASGNLLWQRSWGEDFDGEAGNAVATSADGFVYLAGTRRTDHGGGPASLFIVKFDANGGVVWQKESPGAFSAAVTAAADGSVYLAGIRPRAADPFSQYDVLALKISAAGDLVWDKTYSAGEIVDARGGIAATPDGGVAIAGAIQAAKGGLVGIAALLVKLDLNGDLVFGREWGGRVGDAASAIAVAPDGSIYLAGQSSSYGVGGDAFVVHVAANGKGAEAATWGGSGLEGVGGVAVAADGTVALAASTPTAAPYSLLEAPRRVSGVKGTLAVAGADWVAAAGETADPAATVIDSSGTSMFGGFYDTALVRFRLIP